MLKRKPAEQMRKPEGESIMRTLALVIPALILSGCAGAPLRLGDEPPICAATFEVRASHAGALVRDGGPLSMSTGRRLIAQLDAYCDPWEG